MTTTLKQLLEEHPEWAELPLVVDRPDGTGYDYIGAAGMVYKGLGEEGEEVVVFAPN